MIEKEELFRRGESEGEENLSHGRREREREREKSKERILNEFE